MKKRKTRRCAPLPATLAIAAAFGLAAAAHADEFLWTNLADGVFGDSANWNYATGDLVPGPGDTALFGGGIPTVQFLQPRVNEQVRLHGGFVTFDLGGQSYTLESASVLASGISIAGAERDYAELSVIGGDLVAAYADLAAADSFGLLYLDDGSGLEIAHQLGIGTLGYGMLDARNGATISSGSGRVGAGVASYGEAALTGKETSWTVEGLLAVGDGGFGSLEITDGANVSAGQGIVAQRDDAEGVVVVSGPGSAWTVDGPIDVGMRGFGTLIIEDGAGVTCDGFSTVGTFPGLPPTSGGEPGQGGFGEVIVDGTGSSWTVTGGLVGGDLHVGFFNVGTLELRGGGRVFVDGDMHTTDNSVAIDTPPLIFVIESADDYRDPGVVVGGEAGVDAVVQLDPAYAPAFGDIFRLVSTGYGIGNPAIELPSLPAPFIWGVNQTATDLEIIVGSDDCEPGNDPDCNGNGLLDSCDIEFGASADCNDNGVPDECEVADMTAADCNGNGVPDACDLTDGGSDDCDGDGVPDECAYASEPDTLLDPAADEGEDFGRSVDVDGDRIVVGATGRVLVYAQRGSRWVREAMLTPSVAEDAEGFGHDVAIDGDRLIVSVGADDSSDPEAPRGAAYVYERCGATWCETQRITPSDPDDLAFGWSVDVDGEWLVIGARREPRGIGYVYHDDGGIFSLETSFEVSDVYGTTFSFGVPVAIDDDVLAVGYRAISGGRGAIQTARLIGGVWQAETLITAPPGKWFPFILDFGLAGDVLGVPAHGGDEVFVYRFDGDAWREDAALRAPIGGSVGPPIAADHGRLVVREEAGAIVFDDDEGTWRVASVLTLPSGGYFRPAVQGDRVVGGVSDDGAAYVYEIAGPDCNGNGIPDACDIADGTSEDLDGDGVPDECADPCPWDLTGSGGVGFADLSRLLGEWGFCPNCSSDFDGDGSVGFDELVQLLGSWGPCPAG